ncbi:MAG TPA: plastocyanin/azurin family copper-binding protein [Gemmatimonadales bacterium]|nr:plastocyanin/azurin family copper-binding protein [Gemmatimonadales bacterium]
MNLRLTCALAATLALLACSSSTDPTQPGVDVSIKPGAENLGAAAFAPSPFTISLASQTTVKWRNGDVGTSGGAYGTGATAGTTHQITSDTQGLFDSGSFAPGAVFEHTFTTPGTYHYHCAIHPTMTGIIVVNP